MRTNNIISFLLHILRPKEVLSFILSILSCGLVPLVYVCFIQITHEKLRITYISNNHATLGSNLMSLLAFTAIMAIAQQINGYIISIFLEQAYNQIHKQVFKKIYLCPYNEYGKQDILGSSLKGVDDLNLIIRILLLTWAPALFDTIATISYSITISYKLTATIFTITVIKLNMMYWYSKLIYKNQRELSTKSLKYQVFAHNVISHHMNNKIYELSDKHFDKAYSQIQHNSKYQGKIIYGIVSIESLFSIGQVAFLSLTLYIFTYIKLDVNRAILFSLILNLQKDIWKLTRQIVSLVDLIQSQNIKNIISLFQNNADDSLSQHIQHAEQNAQTGILIKHNNLVLNIVSGLNIFAGHSGCGKTRTMLNIVRTHKNTIMLLQNEAIYHESITNNILGSLPMHEETWNKIFKLIPTQILQHQDFHEPITENKLSGGQIKIIHILRFIYYIEYREHINQRYNMLLIDEPFNHLDAHNTSLVVEYIKLKSQNYIVVLIDHHNKMHNYITKIFYLDKN